MGGWDIQKYSTVQKEEDIKWLPLAEDNWTLAVSSIGFKDQQALGVKAAQITLDTGLSYMMVPPDDINIVTTALDRQDVKCK